MAIEFGLTPRREVVVQELLEKTHDTMCRMLNLKSLLNIQIRSSAENSPSVLGKDGDEIMMEIPEQGEASVMYMSLPDEKDISRMSLAAIINADTFRTDISTVMGIALAIAFGTLADAPIIDDALMLSLSREIDPDELLQRLQLPQPQEHLQSACHELLQRCGMR